MRIYILVILCSVGMSSQQIRIPKIMTTFIEYCSKCDSLDGFISCITEKLLRVVMRASEQKSLQIFPGFEIVNNLSESKRIGKMLEIHNLPSDPTEKKDRIMELLINASSRFISSSVLQIKLPNDTAQGIARALGEGRGKKKKFDVIKLGFAAVIFTIVPIMVAGVGFISAKALIVGKIALVLSIILFVQGFFSSGRNMLPAYGYETKPNFGLNKPSSTYGHGTNTLGGWNVPQDLYPYARSIEDTSSQ